jgi:polar amino acid transport system substrate-binding protein
LLLVYASCDAPRDPRHTLDHVRGRQLTVGVAEARPFIERKGDEASGIEADAIQGFASSLGAKVKWVWGAQEAHFTALHAFQLDMVAGGVTAKTPWA